MAGESSSRTSSNERADTTAVTPPQSSASTSSTSKASPTTTTTPASEGAWHGKQHDDDDEEGEEEDSVVGDVASVPQAPRKGRSTSFVDAQRPPRPTATEGGGGDDPQRCAGVGCPQPAQLCRQSSRASNRPPSPHYPHIALSLSRSVSAPGAVYIDWEEGDPEDPLNWPARKKWTLVIAVFLFTAITAIIAVGFDAGQDQVTAEFGVSGTVYLLGNTAYLGSVAVAPLVLAPFSELVGRKEIFIVSAFLTAIMLIPQALATNIYGIHIPRIVQGAAASAGNSVTGGIVADLFSSHDRGLPMGFFAAIVFIGQGIGPLATSYTVKAHGWRVSLWWQGAVALWVAVVMLVLFDETRGPVLLSRRAKKMTQESGGKTVYRCRADDEKLSVLQMVKTSVSRPLIYLGTEPIVTFFALWIGLLWASVFMSVSRRGAACEGTPILTLLDSRAQVGSIPIAFGDAYGWTAQQSSLVLLILSVGGCLGWLLNLVQERLYNRAWKRHHGEPPPEARLYLPSVGAVMVPIGLFWFAWGCRAGVHPVVPILGLIFFATGVFPIYLGVFVFLSDVFRRYASSALAAQSFLRNLLAGTLSLAVPPMYNNLGPPVASSVLAASAAVLGLTPFILMTFGPQIRSMSRVAKALQREEEEAEEQKHVAKEKELRRERRRRAKEETLARFGGQQGATTGEKMLSMAQEDKGVQRTVDDDEEKQQARP